MATAVKQTITQRELCLIESVEKVITHREPITGYENKPLVSVEKAVEPLIDIIPSIYERIESAKEHYRSTNDGVTKDESIAIMLYTMSWSSSEQSLYILLNKVLCSSDRQKLKPWFLYLRLLFNGLLRLPLVSETVYRGVKMHFDDEYIANRHIVWWRFTSCTRELSILQQEDFLGKTGARTMFVIKCQSGRDISKHSYFPFEQEVLLLPGTEFQNYSCLNQGDLDMIELREIRSPKPLLQTPRLVLTLDEISFSNSKSSESKFTPLTPKAASVIVTPVTPKGSTQSTVSLPYYCNSRLEEIIADNRYSRELNLTSMGLIDQDMKIVADDAIRTTTTITVLILEKNKIGPQGVLHLCNQLKTNKTITTLDLQYNLISDKGTQYLSGILGHLTRLTILDLCKNQITDKGMQHLGAALKDKNTLRTLNLSCNRFGALGVQHLCHALKSNTTLTNLNLSYNDIGDQGSQYIRDALRVNTTLTTLKLEHTQIKAQGIHYLHEALQQNTTLHRLDLDENFIGERGMQYLQDLKRTRKKLKISFR